MTHFSFTGQVPASKSFFNRALIVQSFFPQLQLRGESTCDDVKIMKAAVAALPAGQPIPCGEAGTVIRFMALRASREKGEFLLQGSPRLLARPQTELLRLLPQLGAQIEMRPDGILIRSAGWRPPREILKVRANESSQFLSGLLLSCWNLPFALDFEIEGPRVSNSYWEMTLRFCQGLGMESKVTGNHIQISAGQKPQVPNVVVEPDYSSAFPLAVAGSLWGEARFLKMAVRSLQPDAIFPNLLASCGAKVERLSEDLRFQTQGPLIGRRHHLLETPDLFPVLAVQAAFSQGESQLTGAPQLAAKESNRLMKSFELLKLAGVACEMRGDDLVVQGQGPLFIPTAFDFDPDQDHRMAMAAGLLKLKNSKITIQTPNVVQKSYPEFWQDLGTAAGRVLP